MVQSAACGPDNLKIPINITVSQFSLTVLFTFYFVLDMTENCLVGVMITRYLTSPEQIQKQLY